MACVFEPIDERVQGFEFGFVERAEDLLVECDDIGERLGDDFSPLFGEIEPKGATIIGVGSTFDPSRGADAIDEPDDVPLGDEKSLCEFLLVDSVAVPKGREDVELRPGEAVFRERLGGPSFEPVLESQPRDRDLNQRPSRIVVDNPQFRAYGIGRIAHVV